MRNSLPWRSRLVRPRQGSLGAGTGPPCSGHQGWSPCQMWISPISLSQMRPAWRSQCCWSYSSTCESCAQLGPHGVLRMGSGWTTRHGAKDSPRDPGLIPQLSQTHFQDLEVGKRPSGTPWCPQHQLGTGSGGIQESGRVWIPILTLFILPSKLYNSSVCYANPSGMFSSFLPTRGKINIVLYINICQFRCSNYNYGLSMIYVKCLGPDMLWIENFFFGIYLHMLNEISCRWNPSLKVKFICFMYTIDI